MSQREQAREAVAKLVELFDRDREEYKSLRYNEDRTRRDFIDPFFEAFGWDISNRQGVLQSYRDVITEDKLTIGGRAKAPDYSFRIGGNRVFFVEAKKPSVNIREDQDPAFQLRRYGWSAKLPLSVLTDFEEFAVYDCRSKPNPSDKTATGRIEYLTYAQYLDRFDFLYDAFAKESVMRGGLERLAKADDKRRGTASVDDEYLASLESWREILAKAIRKDNPALDEEALTAALQKTLDRIVFLRICEDRGLEPHGQLREAAAARKDQQTYSRLFDIFRKADDKYNSGLFDLKNDPLTAELKLDDKPLQAILGQLYYPECPYEFSVIPVEILGNAYERFLGKVLRFTPKGVKTELKPEVRKAGGVFYTPQYIVDYIVKQTVGPLLEGKTPDDVERIAILDPACGSGSFLLGAYQFLLDWHRDWFSAHPEALKGKKSKWADALTPDGRLATHVKKNILTNNIYGVDLDSNAVEVTKLSLMLKALEGETTASVNHQTRLVHERVLPTLDANIMAGNSLVGPDFADELDFDPSAEKKIKPFHWQRRFAKVFERGGFDAVVGNPPYVRQELLTELKTYFQRSYRVYDGKADLYSFFIEQGIKLLRPGGRFSVIVANKWMRAAYGKPLRQWLLQWRLTEITDFGDLPVFTQATTYPCILGVEKVAALAPTPALPLKGEGERNMDVKAERKRKDNETHHIAHHEEVRPPRGEDLGGGQKGQKFPAANLTRLDFEDLEAEVAQRRFEVSTADLDPEGWSLTPADEAARLRRIRSVGVPLGEYVKGRIYRGVLTGLNEAFVIDGATRARLIAEDPRSAEVIKPFLAGRDVKRYQTPKSDKWLILFPKGVTLAQEPNPKLAWKWVQDNYPAIAAHLQPFEAAGKKRHDQGDFWWELRACDYYGEFEREKIMLPDIALKAQATYDANGYYCVNTAYIIPVADKYLVGVLNSKVIDFLYRRTSSEIRGGYLRFIRQYLVELPIPVPSNAREVALKAKIEAAVVELLGLGERAAAASGADRERQLDRAAHLEGQIDGWVEELYGV